MNERQQEIVDNHLGNRCEIITSRDSSGRARACACSNQYREAGMTTTEPKPQTTFESR